MDFALFEAVKGFNYLTGDSKLDDDFVDRINRYWSALIMILFAVILSAKQIVGDPLKCWTPQQFKDPWVQYAEDYCWVKNTYFVPKNGSLPSSPEIRKGSELSYYQWIPYVLTVQAFLYYLPAMIWRMLNWKSGLDLSSIVSAASKQENLEGIGYQLSTNMNLRGRSERNDFCLQRNFLTFLYLFTKLMYAANSVLQFLLLSWFFGGGLGALFKVTRDLWHGVEWHESGHFPRITLCDFAVRALGNTERYTIQCVLTINIFTEKIFIVAGFWMLIVAALTCLNTFNWLTALLLPWRRRSFLRDLLPGVSRLEIDYFLDSCVGTDGLLVFHLIATNSDELMAGRLLRRVFDDFNKKRGMPDSPYSDSIELPERQPATAETQEDPEAGTLPLKSRWPAEE